MTIADIPFKNSFRAVSTIPESLIEPINGGARLRRALISNG